MLSVEYFNVTQRTVGPKGMMQLSNGLKKGQLCGKEVIREDVYHLFVSLLQENHSNLDQNNQTLKSYKKLPKGWKFSILRPVDLSKRSGVRICPECGKAATQVRSGCKMVTYCSRECQPVQWKKYKSSCKKLQEKNSFLASFA